MLKKQERLTKSAFDRSFAIGKRLHTPELQLIYHPAPTPQAAVVVGKKVYKKAVDRNQLRRRLYEVLRRCEISSHQPQAVIVVAKPAITALSRTEQSAALRSMLQRIGY